MTTALTQTDHQPTGTRRLKLRKWMLKITLIIAILTPLTFMIGALGTKFGLWSLNFGFGVIVRNIGPKLIMVCGLLGLISLIFAGAFKPRKGFVSAGLAIFIALSGGLYGKSVSNKAAKLPFIHDVTTNTQDVPVFTDAIMNQRAKVKGVNTADYIGKRDRREDELVSVLQTQAFPDIRPLILADNPETVFIKAEILKMMSSSVCAHPKAAAPLLICAHYRVLADQI